MKYISGNNGFTLIEIVVSVAIILLITVTFAPLFVQSYASIFNAGSDWSDRYQVQQTIETDNNGTAISTTPLQISFPSPPGTINVPGSTYQIQQNATRRQITIVYFKPET